MTEKQTEQMKKIIERIKFRREELHLSFQQLAELTGMSKSTLQRYETGGIKNIPLDKLEILAKALNTTPEWILGWNRRITELDAPILNMYPGFVPGENYVNELEHIDKIESNAFVLPQENVVMRPLYNSVAAGFGVIADNTIVAYLPTFITTPSEQEQYIWINVQGDSMSPLIDDGSKILVKKQDSVDSGQVGVVLIDGEDAVVKKIRYGNDWIELISVNPYYPPRRFEKADIQRVRVVGLVKEVSKQLQ